MRLKCNSVGSIGSAKSYGGPNKQRNCDSRSRCLLEQTPWQTSTTIVYCSSCRTSRNSVVQIVLGFQLVLGLSRVSDKVIPGTNNLKKNIFV